MGPLLLIGISALFWEFFPFKHTGRTLGSRYILPVWLPNTFHMRRYSDPKNLPKRPNLSRYDWKTRVGSTPPPRMPVTTQDYYIFRFGDPDLPSVPTVTRWGRRSNLYTPPYAPNGTGIEFLHLKLKFMVN